MVSSALIQTYARTSVLIHALCTYTTKLSVSYGIHSWSKVTSCQCDWHQGPCIYQNSRSQNCSEALQHSQNKISQAELTITELFKTSPARSQNKAFLWPSHCLNKFTEYFHVKIHIYKHIIYTNSLNVRSKTGESISSNFISVVHRTQKMLLKKKTLIFQVNFLLQGKKLC